METDTASDVLWGLVEEDGANYGAFHHSLMSRLSLFIYHAHNNLAIALLGLGKLKEGTHVLEAALQASPLTLAMAEPFLFNPCACFARSCLYLFSLAEHGAPTSFD